MRIFGILFAKGTAPAQLGRQIVRNGCEGVIGHSWRTWMPINREERREENADQRDDRCCAEKVLPPHGPRLNCR
jgi:hypothetical protein